MTIKKVLIWVASSIYFTFAAVVANAAVLTEATINSIRIVAGGNYVINATDITGTDTRWIAILTTRENAKELLALFLTAHANGDKVTINYDGQGVTYATMITQ